MRKNIPPAQRLVVAGDFDIEEFAEVRHDPLLLSIAVGNRIVSFAEQFKSLGVTVKYNTALRNAGTANLGRLRATGICVAADFKYCDIDTTLENDGAFIEASKPLMVTAMCNTGSRALQALRSSLPKETLLIGVTVLTTMTDDDTSALYGCKVNEAIMRLAEIGIKGGVDGFVCAPSDILRLRNVFGKEPVLLVPGIRPRAARVRGEDQNPDRIGTPERAIADGADYIVVGRPITQAEDPVCAARNIIQSITPVCV